MYMTIVWVIGVLSLLFAYWLGRSVLSQDKGSDAMQEIADAIRIGANAFLKRQYTTIAILSVVLAVIILFTYSYLGKPSEGWVTAVAFLFGAACSAVSGFIGMWVAVRANLRTAAAAKKA